MGEVMVFDKEKADTLLSLGFKYTIRTVDNQEVYVFIQTEELMKYICSKFDKQSFVTKRNVCF